MTGESNTEHKSLSGKKIKKQAKKHKRQLSIPFACIVGNKHFAPDLRKSLCYECRTWKNVCKGGE